MYTVSSWRRAQAMPTTCMSCASAPPSPTSRCGSCFSTSTLGTLRARQQPRRRPPWGNNTQACTSPIRQAANTLMRSIRTPIEIRMPRQNKRGLEHQYIRGQHHDLSRIHKEMLEKSKTMRRLSTVLVACTILSGTTGLAWAGGCAEHIKALRQAAQPPHEPTPESLGPVQSYGPL